MSRQSRQKNRKSAVGAETQPQEAAATPPAIAEIAEDAVADTPDDESVGHNPMQDLLTRMQALLGERIDHTRETLRSNEQSFSRLDDYVARNSLLEAEIRDLQKSQKTLEIHANQMSAETAVLRNRIDQLQMSAADLEEQRSAAEANAGALRQVIKGLQAAAGEEIGRVVMALLPRQKGGLVKKHMSVPEQAQLLLDTNVIDPDWYLMRYSDVAAAGMDPALHYRLYGAQEGRLARSALEDAAAQT